MKNIGLKRIFALLCSVAMLLSLMCVNVGAVAAYDIDPSYDGSSSFTITKTTSDTSNLKNIGGVVFEYVKVAEMVQYTSSGTSTTSQLLFYLTSDGEALFTSLSSKYGTAIGDDLTPVVSDYDLGGGNTVNLYSATQIQNLLTTLSGTDYYDTFKSLVEGLSNTQSDTTDDNGEISVENLNFGIYLVVEKDSSGAYIYDNGTRTAYKVDEEAVPYLVALPQTSSDGTSWVYSVATTPKNSQTSSSAKKEIVDPSGTGTTSSTSYSVGDIIPYKITTDYLSATTSHQYTDFYIKDTVTGVIYGTTTTLTQTAIEDFATVTLYANSSDTTGTELDYGDDYTVTFSYDASGNATAFTLQFTSDGIDKLSTAAIAAANNGDDTSYMTITYNGTVIAAGTTSNSAQIFYNYGEGEIEEDPKDPESETFDIELIKLFSGTGTPDATEVEFVLSTDADGTNVIYTTKSSDGVYVVDTSLVSGSTMSPVSDGTLKIQGLADGTYYITEVQTAEGYSLLDDPVLVTINGATITLTITNEKDSIFNLPVTGGLGAIGYTAIGIGFICLAVFMVTKLCGAKKVK